MRWWLAMPSAGNAAVAVRVTVSLDSLAGNCVSAGALAGGLMPVDREGGGSTAAGTFTRRLLLFGQHSEALGGRSENEG